MGEVAASLQSQGTVSGLWYCSALAALDSGPHFGGPLFRYKCSTYGTSIVESHIGRTLKRARCLPTHPTPPESSDAAALLAAARRASLKPPPPSEISRFTENKTHQTFAWLGLGRFQKLRPGRSCQIAGFQQLGACRSASACSVVSDAHPSAPLTGCNASTRRAPVCALLTTTSPAH